MFFLYLKKLNPITMGDSSISRHSCVSKKSRSSRPEVFCKNGVLKNFTKFTVEHLCQGLLFNTVPGLRCFPVNFTKIL